MAFDRKHIQLSGEFNALQKGVLIKSFDEVSSTPAEAQDDSAAEDVAGIVDDFNSLLAKLRAAGIMDS